jgi:hypothetical protein
MTATLAPEPQIETPAPHKECGWLEIIIFTIALVAFALIMVDQLGATILFTRHFWLDEYLTSLIVLDPKVKHSIRAVLDGVDTNPPVYHLLLRAFYGIVRGRPETTFRLFSAVCMFGALIMTYASLRRAFKPAAAAVAILGLTSHPLLIKQASEARFYAALFFASAGFAYFYCGDADRNNSWFDRAGLVISAVLTCTLHYFGVFALLAIMAGDWLVRGFDRRRLIPALAGPIATLASVPIALSQRRGLTVPTWIEQINFDDVSQLFGVVWDMRPAVVLLFALFISLAWRARRTGMTPPTTFSTAALRPLTGLVALFLVPLVIMLFSLLVQPSWVAKYAIAGTLAVVPFLALFASWTRRVALAVVALALIGLTILQLNDYTRIEIPRDKGIANRGKHWAARGNKQLFVFVARNNAYMVPYASPKLRRRVVLVDMADSGIEPPTKYHAFELQMATKVARHYPIVRMIKPQDLRNERAFDFVGDSVELAWLSKAIPLRKTPEGFYKPLTTAPATTTTTSPTTAPTSTTAPASAKRKAAARARHATTHAQ